LPESEDRVIETNVLTPPELRKVIDFATERWRPASLFGVFTGASRAEIAGLKWPDIDWNMRSARIERTWQRGKFYPPKTKASRRIVELPDEMLSELKRWRLRAPKSPEDLVFPTREGTPMSGNDLLRSGFHPALSRAGIRRVRFHDLRIRSRVISCR
jgi:integrase